MLVSTAIFSISDANIAFARANLDYEEFVQTSKKYFRPNEVDHLLGDNSKEAILNSTYSNWLLSSFGKITLGSKFLASSKSNIA